MGEPPAPPAPEPVVPGEPGGFLQDLVDLYFAPRQAFGRIVRSPKWVLPLVGALAIAIAFTAVWSSRMEPKEFLKTQLQESGHWDRLPPDQREPILDQQAKFMPVFVWVGAVLGTVVFVFAIAGGLLFVYRFFYAGEVGFEQALAITSWSMFAISLVTSPLTLAVMGLKDDWNLDPREVLQANLGLLLDKSEVARPLWVLATSLDLFSFWLVFLLASGFGVACRRPTGAALWGVVVPWAILIAVGVGWAAMF